MVQATTLALCLATALALLAAPVALADSSAPLVLAGWGIDEKDPDAFMAQAEEVGFDELITWSTDPAFLARAVEAGAKHGIAVFSCIAPMGGPAGLWRKRYPDRPVPWQVMTPEQEAALRFISAGRNQYLIPYQFGCEPVLTHEVLTTRILCFSDQDARELFRPLIDQIVSVPGLAGLAFDGFGYQNYLRCHCDRCNGLLAEYAEKHPELAAQEAEVGFFRDLLVGYVNGLADYARSQRPDIQTCVHIWPVFAPEPLYGNRLDVDLCGQTAAWYTLWPEGKIAAYSRIISGEARKYHPRQEGVGMIGYYDRPGEFPVKSAEVVDMEIRAMVENGCRSIQVCGAGDVIENAEVAAVFRKHFR